MGRMDRARLYPVRLDVELRADRDLQRFRKLMIGSDHFNQGRRHTSLPLLVSLVSLSTFQFKTCYYRYASSIESNTTPLFESSNKHGESRKMMAAVLLLLSFLVNVSGYTCPSSPAMQHASCQNLIIFENSCSTVTGEIMKRIDVSNKLRFRLYHFCTQRTKFNNNRVNQPMRIPTSTGEIHITQETIHFFPHLMASRQPGSSLVPQGMVSIRISSTLTSRNTTTHSVKSKPAPCLKCFPLGIMERTSAIYTTSTGESIESSVA